MSRHVTAKEHGSVTLLEPLCAGRRAYKHSQTFSAAAISSAQRAPSAQRAIQSCFWLALLFVGCLITSNSLRAQTSYGSVVGTVTDSAGAVVPGAHVQLTNKGTSAEQAAVTSSAGTYTFINLNPGTYSITVTNQGFKSAINDHVEVSIGGSTRADLSLQVGDVSQSITVSSVNTDIQTDSATLGGVIEGLQVQEAPLNGRNVNNVLDFVPGVVPGGGTSGSTVANEESIHIQDVIQRFVRSFRYAGVPWIEAQDAGLFWAPVRDTSVAVRRVLSAIAGVLDAEEQRAFAGMLDRVLGALREQELL